MFGFSNNNKRLPASATLMIILFSVVLLGLPSPAHAISPSSILAYPMYIALSFTHDAIAYLATGLDWALRLSVAADTPVIRQTWIIVRDFANMFFILIMVIMAFATILDLGSFGWAGYDASKLITKLLIAALLINFSLPIGQGIIYYTGYINDVFLRGMTNIDGIILKELKPYVNLWSLEVALPQGLTDMAMAVFYIERAIASLILGVFVAMSLLVAFVFAIIRIPFLWFLLVLSPLAWVTMILPSTQHIHREWWKSFFGWNFFLPIYLFFLYIGLAVLSKGTEVINAVSQGSSGTLAGFQDITVGTIFFYIFAGIVLIGGAGMAFKSSFLAGTAAVGMANSTKNTLTGIASGAYKRTGIPGGVKARTDQLKQEGLPTRFGQFLYGGEQVVKRREAAIGGMLGVHGAERERQQPFIGNVQKKEADIKSRFENGQLSRAELLRMASGNITSDPNALAAASVAASNGLLSATDHQRVFTDLNRAGMTLATEHMVKSAEAGKWGTMNATEKATLMRTVGGTGISGNITAKALNQSMASSSRQAGQLITNDVEAHVARLGGWPSQPARDYIDTLARTRPDLAYEFLYTVPPGAPAGTAPRGGLPIPARREYFLRQLNKPETIAGMNADLWGNVNAAGVWVPSPGGNDDLVEALLQIFSTRDPHGQQRLKDSIANELISDSARAQKMAVLNLICP